MNSQVRLLTIGLLALAVQSCGGGGDAGNGSPVGTTGSDAKAILDITQLTSGTSSVNDALPVASASNLSGEILLLVNHIDATNSAAHELHALSYTPAGRWGSPVTIASGAILDAHSLILNDVGDAIFVLGDTTVARVNSIWQAPSTLPVARAKVVSLAKDPSNKSVAGGLWTMLDPTTFKETLYFSRYRSTGGWDAPELITMAMNNEGNEYSENIDKRALGMDNVGNAYVAAVGDYTHRIASPPASGPFFETGSGIRIRKRTVSGWETPQQLEDGSGHGISLSVAESGTAAIAYDLSTDKDKPWKRTFIYNSATWSGALDTPPRQPRGVMAYADGLIVDNGGYAALIESGTGNGTCYRPKTGWSAVSVPTDLQGTIDASWTPCLGSLQGIAHWNEFTEGNVRHFLALLGVKGWSQRVQVLDAPNIALTVFPSAGQVVVIYQHVEVTGTATSSGVVSSLWAGRWTPPSNW